MNADDRMPRPTSHGEFLRAERMLARAVRAEHERDALRETVARVEALAEGSHQFDEIGDAWVSVAALRAALGSQR